MINYYTGVGSRNTPEDILRLMTDIATMYQSLGWILRSGAARGADTAFEEGAGSLKTIYTINMPKNVWYEKASDLAKSYHGAWDKCSPTAKALHTRNAFQVLGDNLSTPSHFVICWTPDGCTNHYERSIDTGGTGTAISIAWGCSIPVYNLALQKDKSFFESYLRWKNDKK